MSPSPLISIILPVYNAESTLPIALQALLRQTYETIEIIAVNNGSTDKSQEILDKAMQADPRLKVLRTENNGVWNARRAGIAAASGDYIGFCDADDIPQPYMYERLIAAAQRTNAEITVCAYLREDAQTDRVLSTEMTQFGDAVYDVSKNPGILPVINTALWNKLFLASIPKKIAVFEKPSRALSDMMMIISMYPQCKTVAFISEPLYRYRVGTVSIIANITPNELGHLFVCMRQVRAWISGQCADTRFLDVCDLMAFVHLGLSVPLRLKCNNAASWRTEVQGVFSLIDQCFPNYKNSPYATLRYNLKNRMQNAKVMVALWCRKAHILRFVLALYRFMCNTLKVEIKW